MIKRKHFNFNNTIGVISSGKIIPNNFNTYFVNIAKLLDILV